jgi:hypothetical protein
MNMEGKMNMRACLFIAAMLVAAISLPHRADAQVTKASDDPLRHGHALLIGNSHYRDPRWPQLIDIPLQLDALRRGLEGHSDTVQVEQDLEAEQLWQKINGFLRTWEMIATLVYSSIMPVTAIPRSSGNATKIADILPA